MKRRLWRYFVDQRGSVESTLVLVPLLVLFLVGTQIAYAIHARNVERIHAQDDASVRAISGDFYNTDQFIQIESSGDNQNLQLLVTRRKKNLGDLVPGILKKSSHTSIEVSGIAVVENQR